MQTSLRRRSGLVRSPPGRPQRLVTLPVFDYTGWCVFVCLFIQGDKCEHTLELYEPSPRKPIGGRERQPGALALRRGAHWLPSARAPAGARPGVFTLARGLRATSCQPERIRELDERVTQSQTMRMQR